LSTLLTGKSFYNKQERDWLQQTNLFERLDDDYSEMESTFMERQTPGGVKYTSAPGQYPRVCLVLPLLSLILGLVFSLLHLPPVFLGGE
jgi:hypothetical protein